MSMQGGCCARRCYSSPATPCMRLSMISVAIWVRATPSATTARLSNLRRFPHLPSTYPRVRNSHRHRRFLQLASLHLPLLFRPALRHSAERHILFSSLKPFLGGEHAAHSSTCSRSCRGYTAGGSRERRNFTGRDRCHGVLCRRQ